MRQPELLSPAGDLERLKFAVLYGADAVYVGATEFGMRSAPKNFTMEQLAEGIQFAHARGRRVYLTVNTAPTNEEVARMPDFLRRARETGVDAFIVADLGVLAMAKRVAPEVELHLSTQAGIVNYAAATAAYELGAKRAVLARELSLRDIAVIRENTPPELELEAFVHGAMCMSVSGRCLLSHYLTGRDANRGECTQPCRWAWQLSEEHRPGRAFPIGETPQGSYILNADDLCTAPFLDLIIGAGVDSLKIEGRAKSTYYAAIVTGAYRHVIDDVWAGRPVDPVWRDEVERVSHRHYATGFYYGPPGQYTENARYIRQWQVVALVLDCDENGLATLTLRNKFSAGDTVEVVGPDVKPVSFRAPVMEDEAGEPLTEPKNPQMIFKMRLPRSVPALSILRIARDLSAKS